MIGKGVYVTDTKTRKIYDAEIINTYASLESCFKMYNVMRDDGKLKTYEGAHVHIVKEDAEKHLARINPLLDDADRIIKEATEKVDEIREQVIGLPEFEDLVKRVNAAKG